MGATLEALHRLQQIDQELRTARAAIETKQRVVRGIRKKITDLEKQIELTHAQTRSAQSEADRLELDRKAHETHMAKLRETLNKSKTNKEYAAVLTELNTEKADTVKLEETVLLGMAKVDELKLKESGLREGLVKDQQRIADAERAVRELENQLSGRLTDLETRREEAAAQLPPEVLAMFNRAADQNDGDAMASIEQPHPKRADYICGGCNMGVTLETINQLKTRDEIRQCNTCMRILYIGAPVSMAAR